MENIDTESMIQFFFYVGDYHSNLQDQRNCIATVAFAN